MRRSRWILNHPTLVVCVASLFAVACKGDTKRGNADSSGGSGGSAGTGGSGGSASLSNSGGTSSGGSAGTGASGGTTSVNTGGMGMGSGGTPSKANSTIGGMPSTDTGGSAGQAAGGEAGAFGDIPATYETLKLILYYNPINCTSSDCHGGFEGRLDFRDNGGLYDRLLNWTSDVCGMPVINPNAPEDSAIIKVMTTGCGTLTPNCLIGTECIPRMPLNCTEGVDCIPPEYVAAVSEWISNGAPE